MGQVPKSVEMRNTATQDPKTRPKFGTNVLKQCAIRCIRSPMPVGLWPLWPRARLALARLVQGPFGPQVAQGPFGSVWAQGPLIELRAHLGLRPCHSLRGPFSKILKTFSGTQSVVFFSRCCFSEAFPLETEGPGLQGGPGPGSMGLLYASMALVPWAQIWRILFDT